MPKEYHKLIPACHLFLRKENKILLLRRFNTGWQDGKYSVVAGHIEPRETATQCMAREAKEEGDLDITPNDLELVHMMHRISAEEMQERFDLFFIPKQWEGTPRIMEPHKCDDLRWFDIDNLPENMVPYVKDAIEHIKNNTPYSEHGVWDT